jgi:hypothetical protein
MNSASVQIITCIVGEIGEAYNLHVICLLEKLYKEIG